MPTYAELTSDMLKDAATFYRTLGAQNPPQQAEMTKTAGIYEAIATRLAENPQGAGPKGDTYGAMAAKLLRDTAKFYRQVGAANEPIREQMDHNANMYEQLANAVETNPLGILD